MHIPTIGDLRIAGELLECGCRICGRHGYFDLMSMSLPDELPVMFAAMRLKCTTCGARNERDTDAPIWARGDARLASCPAGPLERPAGVDYDGTLDKAEGIPCEREAEAATCQISFSPEVEAQLAALRLRRA